ncbi:putative vacuolar protein sorting-associated protein [Neospora caninum Liverpool]|uniref:Putative vacuolar protein sorting-associated protein n=1 Tax=Neospora caninum (strain Liverpool) TaxID=572307 RepID=F0VJ83_NEOCL|nr:putative vacuolar protein sorting-associated protein [Neospora caninum Liverpool]CBZ53794.1 putative vacuolar protein sorting-associated protein [Neospora caninum Liverpool]CEL67787.1 TPA: vacuolar protein sorting-associated protein,putative [Neospora caninum Liverpool]|eukprot:XP_003883826.1 putative vacuolar protein sorting-associated protein [Neospora caninum Liverpool]
MAGSCTDLVVLVGQHIRAILERVPGAKVLLLDQETTGIVSTAVSQSDILQKEVFLVDRIDALPRGRFEHLSCVCFLRPTNENLLLLLQLLHQQSRRPNAGGDAQNGVPLTEDPSRRQPDPVARFKDIYLFFTSSVHQQPQLLQRLAKQDEADKIVQVEEFYVDLYALDPHVFTLNILAIAPLHAQDLSLWTPYEESLFQRMLDGLFSCVALLRIFPLVRFQSNSVVSKRLAAAIQMRLSENADLLDKRPQGSLPGRAADASAGSSSNGGSRLILLIVDRREDPVTPLLNQWTYRAMLHELIGIQNNRVDMRRIPGTTEDLLDIVMSPMQDKFYRDNLDSNFGDLGLNVQKYVREYQSKTESTGQLESVEDMQRFVDAYPEVRKLAGNVSKHVAVIHALSKIVSDRALLDVSSLEQEIACKEARSDHFAQVADVIRNDRISNMDKLRLVLLVALRYEGDPRIHELTEGLRRAGIEEEEILLVRAMTQYAGRHARSADLFSNRNFLAVAKNTIQRGLKGTSNVYTQHRSLLWFTVESLIRGRLSTDHYPVSPPVEYGAAASAPHLLQPSREKPQTVVVFMVGGTTFEEARDMAELSKQTGCTILLGGSTVHNSRSFLADLSQLIKGQGLQVLPPLASSWRGRAQDGDLRRGAGVELQGIS